MGGENRPLDVLAPVLRQRDAWRPYVAMLAIGSRPPCAARKGREATHQGKGALVSVEPGGVDGDVTTVDLTARCPFEMTVSHVLDQYMVEGQIELA
jgi:hypothetical protein